MTATISDLTGSIVGSACVIHQRKPELVAQEIRRLMEENGVCAPARECMVLRLCTSASIA